MLARERASIAHNQVGGAFHKFPVIANSRFAAEIEAEAHMNAPMPEVSVERTRVGVLIHQLANVTQVAAQLFRSDRRVIPAFPLGRRAGGKGGGAGPRFAQMPNSRASAGV